MDHQAKFEVYSVSQKLKRRELGIYETRDEAIEKIFELLEKDQLKYTKKGIKTYIEVNNVGKNRDRYYLTDDKKKELKNRSLYVRPFLSQRDRDDKETSLLDESYNYFVDSE